MMSLLSPEMRRDPYPLYDQLRTSYPLLRVPPPFNAWMIFDYEGVKWVLNDHETFSSQVPAPQWFIFFDPPAHTKLRALVSQAFTPRMVASLDRRIRELSRQLLDQTIERGEMDLAGDFSAPLATKVIAGIIWHPLDGLDAIQAVERCHFETQLYPLRRRGGGMCLARFQQGHS
jgi:cytochrome P450